ncbi:diaminobutyrate--2-oxoglutarate transaminase [Thermoactinomyces sp. DSM 45892]|uniref:diaminobutyrate--2-oxoglutarate transaminase n=1 Tax=Thermoactinomyces sp. DSM 45892 TaxID=1882753 RepID=UPI00089AB4BB|nr:diaminobutyrate--2-oxoglutarate transaminase [Thermoactinomyces sp. DSM 45892]SDY01911.1 diaminobutyrate aminotransferase apoenzyme [Thermoactinomyces sp. DSM 45892]
MSSDTYNNQHYLDRQSIRESNARSYPRRIPLAIRKAVGIQITDVEGKVYYDCLAGAGTLALGHNHPVVKEAILEMVQSDYPLHTLDLTTPIKDEFVEELYSVLPSSFAQKAKIQFCGPAGTDAVEAALKIVKTATGKRSILSYRGGYHGMTHGALSLMGNLGAKEDMPGLMPDVHFLPYPYPYRCPFGVGGDKGIEVHQHFLERFLDDPERGVTSPAGLIIEMVQGEGGAIPAPNEWARHVRETTKKHDIPMIVDEIQTGFGRTGKMFAFEHAEIEPDVLVLSKAIGGSLPLAVVVYKEELDKWGPGAHAGTFRGNQMAMATGLATIRFIRENNLADHAEKMGELLRGKLHLIQDVTNSIGEVRGKGLMVGVEIVNFNQSPDHLGSYPAHPELARLIQQECFKRGLILELGGRHGSVVRFLPPLIITSEQIEEITNIFGEAVLAAEKTLSPRQEATIT